jgi:adenine/guanine phosphoribosyltransferase-like PRPP-binding protein
MTSHFTEATSGYWQRIVDTGEVERCDPPWRFGYPAALPDGRILLLPIRRLASDPSRAVASLILNQASLPVVDALGAMLAPRLEPYAPELLVGLPTLGLALVPIVARILGHTRYVPLGTSRKFWYDEALSVPINSITSPVPGRRLYLDPNQRSLLEGRRLALVDDVISTGTTLRAAWDLLTAIGGEVVACGVAMRQGTRWVDRLGGERAARVLGVLESPLLGAVPDGWVPRE